MRTLKVTYFTDPWCAWCWASEPNLLRMIEEYGDQLDISYKMGGLIEDLSRLYGEGQVPVSDIMSHWKSVSKHSGMPINGKVLDVDPPKSTWPANIAFKSAEFQGQKIAVKFLRKMREEIMINGRNASKMDVLENIARDIGLDVSKFRESIDLGKAEIAFREDLRECEDRNIKGFPALIFTNDEGKELSVVGFRKFEDYEDAIGYLTGGEAIKKSTLSLEEFVKKYEFVSTVEVCEVFQFTPTEAREALLDLVDKGLARRVTVSNSEMWETF